ncbi:peptidyl-prolyl cis-trans isomerase [Sphingomonas sp. CARO-RG-8B-R24-01]|uniref:SurA N-terminal domain-containing protein n=1 Tax=Sphingomonas sp. CARO-RG-8B-R24-01 TaxID=2914831 RepID=UPI001F59A270|nr:peptidyl-prolyl cis-trans isomerase [Sphingomonas sp. CARO-RG-8B-R24-01]
MTSKKTMLMTGASALLLLVAGCEKKVGGQVVAVVNGEEVTQQEVNAELQGANIPPTADKKAIMAQVVQQIVDRKLLVQKAKADGLDKSPSYLDQLRRGEDALIINLLTTKAAKSVSLPDAAAVDKFIADNPTLFSGRKRYALDQISFAQPSDQTVLRQLEPAHSLEAVAATLSAAGIQFTRGTSTLDTAMLPPPIAAKIAALPAGEPFVAPDKGRIIASVITATTPAPTPEAQARPAALELLRRQALGNAMQKQLEAARASAKITYQPGFSPPKTPTPVAPATAP